MTTTIDNHSELLEYNVFKLKIIDLKKKCT